MVSLAVEFKGRLELYGLGSSRCDGSGSQANFRFLNFPIHNFIQKYSQRPWLWSRLYETANESSGKVELASGDAVHRFVH